MIPAYVIVEGIEALPTLPEAVARLTALFQKEAATASDFESAVHTDPAVTANLLAAANSSYYRGIEEVTTVSQAVSRIGLRRVYEVAIGSSFRRTLPLRIPGYGIDGPTFWLHCTATAVYAEVLARKFGSRSVDMAFTAGLLHDVGKLIIGGFMDEMMPVSNWWVFGTASAERETLGSNHCDVGREIAQRWHLPAAIMQACRWHHEPLAASDDTDIDLVSIINAADYLAYQTGFPGCAGNGEELNQFVKDRFHVTEAQLVEIAKRHEEDVQRMNELTACVA